SIIDAGGADKKGGAKDVYVAEVHGVCVDNGGEKKKKSGLIKQVLCTNSHINALKYQGDFVKVYDISSVILEGLAL
ncbi:MAG: ribose-phosphate pyrophosphokinase, partial [Alphaproteobacteria bacterium]|nr:ribose-phosphate pyrophosphokinase [Alphaproteobacteria bacterium]